MVRLFDLGIRVEITAPVAAVDRMSPEVALRINGELGCGSLCIRQSMYLARMVIELRELERDRDLEVLDIAMGRVAHIASDLRAQLVVAAGDADCFSMYRE